MRLTIAIVMIAALAMSAGATSKLDLERMEPPAAPFSRGLLDCTDAVELICGQPVSGDNTGLPNNVVNYGCSAYLDENGGEAVYFVTVPEGVCWELTITMTPSTCDLDLWFLGSCDEADCIDYSAGTSTETIVTPCLEPGTYYVVVDGYGSSVPGAECPFELVVDCVECDCPTPPCCPFPHTCFAADYNEGPCGTMFMDCGLGPNPWVWGAADPDIPQVACDDVPVTHILGTTVPGAYPASTGGIAYIGPFDITEDCSCLELCHYYDFESGYDGGNVKVSTDGGATWVQIDPADGYDDVLDSTYYIAECVADEYVFTGDSVTFVRDCFGLEDFIGQQVLVGFFFGSESYATSDLGWYIKWAKIGGDEVSPVENTTWGSIKSLYR
ncbi:MAG: hypothetical protein GF400_03595 [Candidatus Eisenbacteria bacterium]|nr:hypothetical protein [Candidatus Eisenbacteria bacterium]